MRLSLLPAALFVLPVLGLPTFRGSPTVHSPVDSAAAIIASRQHHETRALVDVCVALDTGALASLSPLAGTILGTRLDLCLCLSAFPLDVYADARLGVLASLLGGAAKTNAALQALINASPARRTCSPLPPHSHRLCSAKNPCGYQCDVGRIPVNDQCVCAPGTIECNGVCQPASKPCGSAVPRPHLARSSLGSASYSCSQPGHQLCAVPNGGTECINTLNTLESCGGCLYPGSITGGADMRVGRDCSVLAHLPGVLDLACVGGGCRVTRCAPGYSVNSLGDNCVLKTTTHTDLRLGLGSTISNVDSTADTDVKLTTGATTATTGFVGSKAHTSAVVADSTWGDAHVKDTIAATDGSTTKLATGLDTSASTTVDAGIRDSSSTKSTLDTDLTSSTSLDGSMTDLGLSSLGANTNSAADAFAATRTSTKSALDDDLRVISDVDSSRTAPLGSGTHDVSTLAASTKSTVVANTRLTTDAVADTKLTADDTLHAFAGTTTSATTNYGDSHLDTVVGATADTKSSSKIVIREATTGRVAADTAYHVADTAYHVADTAYHVATDGHTSDHSYVNLARGLLDLGEAGRAGVVTGGELLRDAHLGLFTGLAEKFRLGVRWVRNSDWGHHGPGKDHASGTGAGASGTRLPRTFRLI